MGCLEDQVFAFLAEGRAKFTRRDECRTVVRIDDSVTQIELDAHVKRSGDHDVGFIRLPETDRSLQRGMSRLRPRVAGTVESDRWRGVSPIPSLAVQLVPSDARERLDSLVGVLAASFLNAGFRFYLVGGIVRDLTLGRQLSGDIDVTTDAVPSDIRRLLRPWADVTWDQGARFGTIGARRGDVFVEITTHRAERYAAESRKPEVTFSTVIDDDLSRRDFTVNAMAIELPEWRLVDPFDGRGDLERLVLRTPIEPAASFTDDPLRMLRAARFSAGYSLAPTQELVAAMSAEADRLDIVSRERIGEELRKLFAIDTPGAGLALLARTGVLARVAPAFVHLTDPPSEAFDRSAPDAALRWAILLWPLEGDPVARASVLRDLRESSKLERRVAAVLTAAEVVERTDRTDVATIRRVILSAGLELERGYQLLDAVGRAASAELQAAVGRVLETEGRSSLRPPLDGKQVMAELDVSGPVVGRALDHLLELRLEEGPMDQATARERLRSWWAVQ